MNFGELKPLLTTLALPPAGPLLLVLAGCWLAWRHKGRGLTLALPLLGSGSLWLLSCNAVAVALSQQLLPQAQPLARADWSKLRSTDVQAVVVLGGGVTPAREYGEFQPGPYTAARLRYGLQLAKASGLPVAFAGGVGWSAANTDAPSEASTAVRWASESGQTIRWLDAESRDTAENAARLKILLQADGIKRIALVTNAWHMPRSQHHFESAGFTVLPAPMGFVQQQDGLLLEWLPSTQGLTSSRQVLREWLALRLLGA